MFFFSTLVNGSFDFPTLCCSTLMRLTLLFRVLGICVLLTLLHPAESFSQKNRKDKFASGRPRIMEAYGDSLRTDSVVIYETEIGYVMPDHSAKFIGKWDILVMKRQARSIPDSLVNSLFEFVDDTLFNAYVGCNVLNGTYTIKGPTIKFTVFNSVADSCSNDIERWFIKLIQERVSYFGVDEKILYLKDVAFNVVFDCVRKNETR